MKFECGANGWELPTIWVSNHQSFLNEIAALRLSILWIDNIDDAIRIEIRFERGILYKHTSISYDGIHQFQMTHSRVAWDC